MKLVTWNTRGLNKIHKQKELKLFMKENKVSIIAVIEHKVKENVASRIIQKIAPGWKFEANYEHTDKGRLWVLWDPQVIDCTMMSQSDQYIQCRVVMRSNTMVFILVAIYGLHNIHDRLKLWEDLRVLVTGAQEPMICMGDFNAVLAGEDRPQGSQVQEVEVKDFSDFMLDMGMTELKSVGRPYTWSNGHTCSKIDRAVVNTDWMLNMPTLEVNVMNSGTSDHAPLSLELERNSTGTFKAFRFFNCIADHPEFLPRVRVAWNGGQGRSMKIVWQKLKEVKNSLKQLNNSEFKGVRDKVNGIREQLNSVQDIMRDPLEVAPSRQKEKELRMQLEKWSMIEESVMKQKSRVQWLKLGDANTAYFFAHMKNRVAQNTITSLMTYDGNKVQTQEALEHEVTAFYKGQLGSSAHSLPSVNATIMRNGKTLNREQQLQLAAQVTKEEVEHALKSISDMKAPGSDGFNALFFKKLGKW